MSTYELTADFETYEVEPGEWRAKGVAAPVFVFASSPRELEIETARVLANYVDWISRNRPDAESFERQCTELGFNVHSVGDDVELQSPSVCFVVGFSAKSKRRIYDQRVTAVLRGRLA